LELIYTHQRYYVVVRWRDWLIAELLVPTWARINPDGHIAISAVVLAASRQEFGYTSAFLGAIELLVRPTSWWLGPNEYMIMVVI
jgi:hypothetical protein